MIERGFLDVKTFKDIVSGRGAKKLITVEPDVTVGEAVDLMEKYNIENLPVIKNENILGSISESGLFTKLLRSEGQDIKNKRIAEVLEAAYPVVAYDTPVERLSSLFNKENGAVLAKDDTGNFHIVTKYDMIQALGN
jgi:cystathionine beta-synthase